MENKCSEIIDNNNLMDQILHIQNKNELEK